MNDQESDNNQADESNNEKALTEFLKDGMPQLLLGPAGKAISRLVGAAVDIPAAWLEGYAETIRDKTKARSIVSKATAQQAAEMAINDPEVMHRATNSLISSTYRKQNNKEAVAAITIEELKEEPPPTESTGPSEDWMNRFERYAEDASSEDLRIMFGKILAGEIRKPGTVSPATLRFVSELSPETAKLIKRVLPYSTIHGVCFTECMNLQLEYAESQELDLIGFWSPYQSYQIDFDKNLRHTKSVNKQLGYAIESSTGEKIVIRASMLSSVGKDLITIVNSIFDFHALANYVLQKEGVSKFYIGDIIIQENDQYLTNVVELNQSSL